MAEMPASAAACAITPVRMYMSAMQVVPEAIISISPREVQAATARSSHRDSTGKIKSFNQS